MERITEKMLEAKLNWLNELSGFDNPEYSTIGAYVLDYAYGGVSLHRYMNEAGGVHDVFRCGHVPKRDLFDRLDAYIAGMENG